MKSLLPPEVLRAYSLIQKDKITPIGNGIVNTTVLVQTSGKKAIIQKLNTVFTREAMQDYIFVSEYLHEAGWEVPRILPTVNGEYWFKDRSENHWRMLSYIESDDEIYRILDSKLLFSVGKLLGKWHSTLSKATYKPTFSIPHFHDTTYYASKLSNSIDKMPDTEVRIFAQKIFTAYKTLDKLPNKQHQLIHGDPQLNNILFKEGRPFTYIDLDTLMFAPIWIDIGDLLRSIMEASVISKQPLSSLDLTRLAEGYRHSVAYNMDFGTFFTYCMIATQHISIELAMRFMNDIVDDAYFAWDSSNFNSRRDSHLARAKVQWKIYEYAHSSVKLS